MSLHLKGVWTEKYAGQSEVVLDDDILTIPQYAFEFNRDLKFIALPESVTKIAKSAFRGCTSLEKAVMPKHMDSIEVNAFKDCENLKSIELPDGLTEISNSTFFSCKSLEYIRIPEGVKRIGRYAFFECTSLKTVYLPKSLEVIDDYAFDSCVNLEKITGGESVRIIGDFAFCNCHKLTDFKLGSSLERIYDSSFSDCPFEVPDYILVNTDDCFINDDVIRIPDGTLTITEQSLTRNDGKVWDEVILPDSVRNISVDAFYSMFSFEFNLDAIKESKISSLPKKMNMPPDYFRQKTAFDAEMAFLLAQTVWKEYVTDEDFEYMLLYQNNKKVQYRLHDILSDNCNRHLINMLKIADNSPLQLEHLASYAATHFNSIDVRNLEILKERAKSCDAFKAVEILDKYCFAFLENSSDRITEYCLKYFSPYAAEKYFPDDDKLKVLLNQVRYSESGEYVPEYIVKCVLYAYMRQIPFGVSGHNGITDFHFVKEADCIAAEFDRESFLRLINELPLNYIQMLIPACRYGDAYTIDKILVLLGHKRPLTSTVIRKALELSESDEAMVLLEKIKYAESEDDCDENDLP